MLSYVFFIFFFQFFLSKSCCTVVFWALQLGISNLLSQEKKKERENIFSSKCVNSKVVWRDFFFLFSLFLAANSNRFVCFRLFLSISFFFFFLPHSHHNDSFVLQIFWGLFFFSIIPCRILGHCLRFHPSRQRYHYWICFFLVWQRHF